MPYKMFRAAVGGYNWQVSYFCGSKRPFPKHILSVLEKLLFSFHDRKPYGQKIRVPL